MTHQEYAEQQVAHADQMGDGTPFQVAAYLSAIAHGLLALLEPEPH